MNGMTYKEIAEALSWGARADIWYDADYYEDERMLAMIGRLQRAMVLAADILGEGEDQ